MITKYNTYNKIFENNEPILNLIKNKLDVIITNINKEFNDTPIFILWNYSSNIIKIQCNIKIIYTLSIDDKYCYLFNKQNHLIQREKINNYDTLLNVINKQIIFQYLFDLYDIDFLFYNDNITYDDFVNKFGLKNLNLFKSYYKRNMFPSYIMTKYKYILDAENFDLI